MAFPEGVETVVLTGHVASADGESRRDAITLTPSVPEVVSTAADYVLTDDPITVTPDRDTGVFSVTLLANDAAGFEPSGWTYTVSRRGRAPYPISLPAAVPTVDLAELTSASPSTGMYALLAPVAEIEAYADAGDAATLAAAKGYTDSHGAGTPASSVVAGTAFGQASAAGAAVTYSRGDHVHGTPAAPTKASVGLGNVDNTSDASKPLSIAATAALAAKADLVGGLVSTAQLPALAISDTFTVASQAAMLALTAQRGDIAVRTDSTPAKVFILAADDPTILANWVLISFGSVASVNSQTGAVTLAAADVGAVSTTDPRLTDNRTPTGTAGGDLGGTFPNPTVSKVAGATVSGTPATGKVLTATSGGAASWQTPAAGGGGGAAIVSQGDDRIDLEIVVLTNSPAWAVVRTSGGVAIGKSVKATAGDRILVSPSFMYAGTQYELDLAVMASDGTSISRYAGSSGSGTTPGAEGYPPLYTQATSFPHITGPIMFTVAAGEVDGSGRFTVNLAYYAPSLSGIDQKIYAGAGYIARWLMLNIGPEPA